MEPLGAVARRGLLALPATTQLGEPLGVADARVLRAAVGVVDESGDPRPAPPASAGSPARLRARAGAAAGTGSRADQRAPPSRPPGSAARAGSQSPGWRRRLSRPPAGSSPRRSTRRADNATRTRTAPAGAGRLDHPSGPPSRAGAWSTTRLAGGSDAISRLEGVRLVQREARHRPHTPPHGRDLAPPGARRHSPRRRVPRPRRSLDRQPLRACRPRRALRGRRPARGTGSRGMSA